jgi:hypothetical protein
MSVSPRRRRATRLAYQTLALAALTGVGCGSVKQTGTARTGTEQLLLTNAWDRAIQKVDFRPLTGVPIYLDTANVNAVDQGYVISSIRHALLSQGALLKQKPEQAQYIVEARVGAYGTDAYNLLIGVPQTTVPQTVTGMPSGTIPEISLAKKVDQLAVAKLSIFAYDRNTGHIIWDSGDQIDTASAKDTYIGGFGPIQSGTIRGGTQVLGVKVPLTSDDDSDDKSKRKWWQLRKRKPQPPPTVESGAPSSTAAAPMAAKTDLDSIRP